MLYGERRTRLGANTSCFTFTAVNKQCSAVDDFVPASAVVLSPSPLPPAHLACHSTPLRVELGRRRARALPWRPSRTRTTRSGPPPLWRRSSGSAAAAESAPPPSSRSTNHHPASPRSRSSTSRSARTLPVPYLSHPPAPSLLISASFPAVLVGLRCGCCADGCGGVGGLDQVRALRHGCEHRQLVEEVSCEPLRQQRAAPHPAPLLLAVSQPVVQRAACSRACLLTWVAMRSVHEG